MRSTSAEPRRCPGIRRAADEVGATAVEYGLLLALLAGVIIGTVRVLGETVTAMFNAAVGTF